MAALRERSDGRCDMTRQLLRITTAGSVDDGKSTLIGRLLHDTDSLPLDHLEAVTDDEGIADLAALSDGLRAEREQGITIDVAYRFFSTRTAATSWPTPRATSATPATCSPARPTRTSAILLVDARAGVLRQTRRHARIAKLLGIEHFVAAVNKIDLVDFDQARFAEVRGRPAAVGRPAGRRRADGHPDRGEARRQRGHRSDQHPVVRRPDAARVLSRAIELSAPHPAVEEPAACRCSGCRDRPPRQRTPLHRPLVGGTHCGSAIPFVSLPVGRDIDGDRARHARRRPRRSAVAPLSVSIELADDIDVGRGDVFVSGAQKAMQPSSGAGPRARRRPCAGSSRHRCVPATGSRSSTARRTVRATVQALHSGSTRRLWTISISQSSWRSTTSAPSRCAPVRSSSPTGTRRTATTVPFILIDETSNDTVGAGTITEAREVKPGEQTAQRHPMASLVAGPRLPLGQDRDSAARPSGSPDFRRRASRRSPSPSNARWSKPARSPTCSTATTSATDCPTTWASRPAIAPRTSAG